MLPAPADTTLHVPLLLLTVWAGSVAYFDARFRRIPNELSLGAWVVALAILVVHQSSFIGAPAMSALTAAALAMLLTLPGYLTRRLGAGDVKFLVGIGLLTSAEITWWSFVVAALIAGLVAILWLNAHMAVRLLPLRATALRAKLEHLSGTANRHSRFPFGPPVAIGLISVLWLGPRL